MEIFIKFLKHELFKTYDEQCLEWKQLKLK